MKFLNIKRKKKSKRWNANLEKTPYGWTLYIFEHIGEGRNAEQRCLVNLNLEMLGVLGVILFSIGLIIISQYIGYENI